jgi:hypothetical protein
VGISYASIYAWRAATTLQAIAQVSQLKVAAGNETSKSADNVVTASGEAQPIKFIGRSKGIARAHLAMEKR